MSALIHDRPQPQLSVLVARSIPSTRPPTAPTGPAPLADPAARTIPAPAVLPARAARAAPRSSTGLVTQAALVTKAASALQAPSTAAAALVAYPSQKSHSFFPPQSPLLQPIDPTPPSPEPALATATLHAPGHSTPEHRQPHIPPPPQTPTSAKPSHLAPAIAGRSPWDATLTPPGSKHMSGHSPRRCRPGPPAWVARNTNTRPPVSTAVLSWAASRGLLDAQPILDPFEKVCNTLRHLLPVPTTDVPPAAISKAILAQGPESLASGVSHWTQRLDLLAHEGRHQQHARATVLHLVQAVVDGNLPTLLRLLDACLLPFAKPSRGVRPFLLKASSISLRCCASKPPSLKPDAAWHCCR
jgi:hypothetical protein